MSLDLFYVPLYTLSEGSILDKDTAAPLASGIVHFYRDSQRGDDKPVYQLTGTSPNYTFVELTQPLTLSAIGTFVDTIGNPVVPYLYPYDESGAVDLYYATVYSSLDGTTPAVFQFDVEAMPHLDPGGNRENAGINFQNEITNSQFVDVAFYPTDSDYTYSVTGGVNAGRQLAAGWAVYVNGTGSFTVKRVALEPALTPAGIPTNPPYALDFTSTGFTDLRLRQRFSGNIGIFSNGALNGYFLGRTMSGGPFQVQMTYNQSSGNPSNQSIITGAEGSLPSGGAWTECKGSVVLAVSDSTDTAPDGYVDIDIIIPVGAHIQITSIQLVSSPSPLSSTNNIYDQQTIAGQQSDLFYYYHSFLNAKPIPNFTLGWDFGLNPCQQLGTAVAATPLGANKSRYIADQTIAFEAVSNVLSYSFNTASGMTVATTGTTQFAIIQYLDTPLARDLLKDKISVQLRAKVSSGTLECAINIYWTTNATLPVITSISGQGDSIVATMLNGLPDTFNGTWTRISRGSLNGAELTLTDTLTTYDFSNWNAAFTTPPGTETFVAIVLSFGAMTSSQTCTIDYCCVCPGEVATRPSPLNESQTLMGLQTYYETSWESGAVGTLDQTGSRVYQMDWNVVGGNTESYAQTFSLVYNVPKRSAATPVLYSTQSAVTAGNVSAYMRVSGAQTIANDAVATWWVVTPSKKSALYVVNSLTTLASVASGVGTYKGAFIDFHYICDSRLGVI